MTCHLVFECHAGAKGNEVSAQFGIASETFENDFSLSTSSWLSSLQIRRAPGAGTFDKLSGLKLRQ